jgi:hypothetical protein
MYITDYYFMYSRFYSANPKKVQPVAATGDPAYQEPDSERQKGKRNYSRKAQYSGKISGKTSVNIWV